MARRICQQGRQQGQPFGSPPVIIHLAGRFQGPRQQGGLLFAHQARRQGRQGLHPVQPVFHHLGNPHRFSQHQLAPPAKKLGRQFLQGHGPEAFLLHHAHHRQGLSQQVASPARAAVSARTALPFGIQAVGGLQQGLQRLHPVIIRLSRARRRQHLLQGRLAQLCGQVGHQVGQGAGAHQVIGHLLGLAQQPGHQPACQAGRQVRQQGRHGPRPQCGGLHAPGRQPGIQQGPPPLPGRQHGRQSQKGLHPHQVPACLARRCQGLAQGGSPCRPRQVGGHSRQGLAALIRPFHLARRCQRLSQQGFARGGRQAPGQFSHQLSPHRLCFHPPGHAHGLFQEALFSQACGARRQVPRPVAAPLIGLARGQGLGQGLQPHVRHQGHQHLGPHAGVGNLLHRGQGLVEGLALLLGGQAGGQGRQRVHPQPPRAQLERRLVGFGQ